MAETPLGQPLQTDFGNTAVEIGGEVRRAHQFVSTLGDSRTDPYFGQPTPAWTAIAPLNIGRL